MCALRTLWWVSVAEQLHPSIISFDKRTALIWLTCVKQKVWSSGLDLFLRRWVWPLSSSETNSYCFSILKNVMLFTMLGQFEDAPFSTNMTLHWCSHVRFKHRWVSLLWNNLTAYSKSWSKPDAYGNILSGDYEPDLLSQYQCLTSKMCWWKTGDRIHINTPLHHAESPPIWVNGGLSCNRYIMLTSNV